MADTLWRLSGIVDSLESDLIASCTIKELQAEIDLRHPDTGIRNVRIAGESFPAVFLLAVDLGGDAKNQLADAYVRGDDLIAAYAEDRHRPVRSEIYWRRLTADIPAAPQSGWEMIVSVQTNLLQSEPRLTVSSQLTAAEVWRMLGDGSAGFQRLDAAATAEIERTREGDAGVFVMRPESSSFSYVQMVHPSDFHRTAISTTVDALGRLTGVAHDLFPESLEKGVIRRGRIRAWLLPRADDLAHAAELYRRWLDEPPPLTT